MKIISTLIEYNLSLQFKFFARNFLCISIYHSYAINNRKNSIQIKAVCLLDIVPRGARGGIAGLGGIIGKS